MTASAISHPPIVSRDQWLAERKKLLADEKELTKHYDRVNAERRRLPMVKVEKDHVLDGPHGNEILKAFSTVAGNSSSITSCSTQHGIRAVQAARVW